MDNHETAVNSLSRRQWLSRISVPVLAAGAGMVSSPVIAAGLADTPGENSSSNAVYNIENFGAIGDGKTLNTLAVQKAIDACSTGKGGTVLVPAGGFVIGTIELKSNVNLHLSVQGKLLGSPEKEDYRRGTGVPPGNGNQVLIYAVGVENISITGPGTIDGNGKAFYTGKGDNTGPGQTEPGYMDRPHLLIFYKCTKVLFRDAFFTRSAYHCFRILQCRQISIDNVRIYNRVNKNNDGFHFNSCEYVRIINCEVRCQDDACALFGSNKFVTITNCSFSTRWSIFRFGSGNSQNIAVSNCLIYDTYGCPVKISAGRARIENLTFSNIIMENVTGPIGIGFSGKGRNNNTEDGPVYMRNIAFNGIRASVVEKPVNHPDIPFEVLLKDGEQHSCITLNGMGDKYIENVSFTDVHVTYAGGGTAALAEKRTIPETASEYFGVWSEAPFGPPAYGMYARNVKGLSLHNVKFDYTNTDRRPALILDNVNNAMINGLNVRGTEGVESLRIINSKDIYFNACRVLTPAASFIRLEGSDNENILVDGGDLRKAAKPAVFAAGADEKALLLKI